MKRLSTFECESCERYIADPELFLVVNRTNRDRGRAAWFGDA